MLNLRFSIWLGIFTMGITSVARAAEPKPSASGMVFMDGAVSEPILTLQQSLIGALGYSPAIAWRSPDLSLPSPNIADVDKTKEHLEKARLLGQEGEVEKGLAELQAAMKLLDDNIYTLCTVTPKAIGRYINVLRRLSVFLWYNNDAAGATAVLNRLFALHPSIPFKKFTKELKPLFTKLQAAHGELGVTTLSVTTDPPGAKVYYNFELQGPSPVKIEEVPAGEAILLAVLPGHEPRVERVQVTPSEAGISQSITLVPGKVITALAPARGELDQTSAGPGVLAAAEFLSVDVLIFVHFDIKGPREVALTGTVFDRRTKTRLSEVRKTVDPQNVTPDQVKAFVASLFDGVRLDGKLGKKPGPKAPEGPGFMAGVWGSVSSLPQKKYFWHAMGGIGGAIIVGAIVTAVLLSGENTDEFRRTTGSKLVLGY